MIGNNGTPQNDFSAEVFIFAPIWREAPGAAEEDPSFTKGGMPVLLFGNPAISEPIEVHHVVEDVIAALPKYVQQGYTIAIEPFESSVGRCAVVQDTAGTRLCILEKIGFLKARPQKGIDMRH